MTASGGTRRFEGRVALVTGAAQGIGRSTAERLASEGCRVGVLDIDQKRGSQVVEGILDHGEQALFVQADVSRSDEVEAAVAETTQRWGRLDVLVNNAGVNAYHDAATMSEAEWDSVFAVDLKAAWLCAKFALPYLVASAGGSITNVSSIHGRLTTSGMFPYAAAKAAVEGLTRSLALDYGPRGLRVNAVAPGWTRTALVDEWMLMQPDPEAAERQILQVHPVRRIATPEQIAAVIAFLASDDAMAVTGAVVAADCGLGARFAN